MNVVLRSQDIQINTISLCTGGGGLDFGLELAIPTARSICMVEREAFGVARLVAAMQEGLMAECPVWSDVSTFNGQPWRGLVDGVIGGIPCQPHSLAGRKQGTHDERDLWSDARRIVVQSRPWFVLIENVAGMLSAGADEIAGAERVWRDLQRLGFTVEGGLFSASEVGASHKRDRVFILGVADTGNERSQGSEWSGTSRKRDGTQAPGSTAELRGACVEHSAGVGRGKGLSEPVLWSGRCASAKSSGLLGDPDQLGECQSHNTDGTEPRETARHSFGGAGCGLCEALVNTFDIGCDGRTGQSVGRSPERITDERTSQSIGRFPPGPSDIEGWKDIIAKSPALEPALCGMVDGVASRVDQLRMLGNGVVPLQAGYAVRTLVTRLAARNAPGADRLVRLMGVAA